MFRKEKDPYVGHVKVEENKFTTSKKVASAGIAFAMLGAFSIPIVNAASANNTESVATPSETTSSFNFAPINLERIRNEVKLSTEDELRLQKERKKALEDQNTLEAKEKAKKKANKKKKKEKAKDDDVTQEGVQVDPKKLKIKVHKVASNDRLGWPTTTRNITSEFDMRLHPISGVYRFHTGMDIANGTCGSPILASADGVVQNTGFAGGYGNRIVVKHSDKVSTAYSHLQSISTSVGSKVTEGQVIGYMGTTGSSTGCHLHFEVIKDNQFYVNPRNWLFGTTTGNQTQVPMNGISYNPNPPRNNSTPSSTPAPTSSPSPTPSSSTTPNPSSSTSSPTNSHPKPTSTTSNPKPTSTTPAPKPTISTPVPTQTSTKPTSEPSVTPTETSSTSSSSSSTSSKTEESSSSSSSSSLMPSASSSNTSSE